MKKQFLTSTSVKKPKVKKGFLPPPPLPAPNKCENPSGENSFFTPPQVWKGSGEKWVFTTPTGVKRLRWKMGFLLPPQVWKAPGEKRLFYYYPHKCGKLPVKNTSFYFFLTLNLVWKARGEKRFHPKTCAKSSRWEKEKGFF